MLNRPNSISQLGDAPCFTHFDIVLLHWLRKQMLSQAGSFPAPNPELWVGTLRELLKPTGDAAPPVSLVCTFRHNQFGL